MRKNDKMKRRILTLCLVLTTILSVIGQNNETDKIIKRDYTIIEAIVTKISEESIEYKYPDESLVNVLKTSKIARIEFANGRVQNFLNKPKAKAAEQQPEEVAEQAPQQNQDQGYQAKKITPNTIAVLPIPFIDSESMVSSQEMAKFAQNDVYNKLIQKSANIIPLRVQDLRVTNNLLRRAGIDHTNIDEILIEDLQSILGVDHIIAAKVSYVINKSKTSTSYGDTEVKAKGNKVRESDYSSSSTYEEKSYDYTLYLDLYKNSTKIYTKTRHPFFDFKDSWMDSMTYLLKRCPIYSK